MTFTISTPVYTAEAYELCTTASRVLLSVSRRESTRNEQRNLLLWKYLCFRTSQLLLYDIGAVQANTEQFISADS